MLSDALSAKPIAAALRSTSCMTHVALLETARPTGDLRALLEARPPALLRRGSTIFADGEAADRLYVVASGLVRLSRVAPDGRRVTLALLDGGMVFGHEALLEDGRYAGSAEALADSAVHVVERGELGRLLAAPQAGALLLAAVGERLAAAQEQVASLAFGSVAARLAGKLLELADRYGKVTPAGVRIDERFTHQQLAELIGTSRETLTKALNELRSAGMLEVLEHRLLLRDQAALARLSGAR